MKKLFIFMFAVIVMASCSKEINPTIGYDIKLKNPLEGDVLAQTTDTMAYLNGFNNHVKLKGKGIRLKNMYYKPTELVVNGKTIIVE